jgi:hypothetical protein
MTAAMICCLCASEARAGGPSNYLYATKSELVVVREGESKSLTKLEDKPRSLQVAASGKSALVELESGWLWIDLVSGTQHTLDCGAGTVLSPSGVCVACTNDTGGSLYAMGKKARRLGNLSGQLFGFGPSDQFVAAVSSGRLLALKPSSTKKPRALANHAPAEQFSVAPNGTRAVGVYSEQGGSSLFTFKLDGNAARRRLGSATTVVGWSGDSQWLLVESKSAACVVRAVGGEYKCWNGYRAGGLDQDGSIVVLLKDGAAHWAPTTGTRPVPPKLLRRKARTAVPLPTR